MATYRKSFDLFGKVAMKTCYVRLKGSCCVVEVEACEEVKKGDIVVCELEKGPCLGEVLSEVKEKNKEGLPKMVKKATSEEVSEYLALCEKVDYAMEFCRRKIEELNLPMKLLYAEYLFGGAKLIFYFYSETRVDFRELVRELAREFRTRIELRQVGVRDHAKVIGGLGNCGDVVCCKRFLNTFSTVSIKMVKEQNLALNPSKISGICGRLLCCLSYEYEMYLEFKKNFPKIGSKVYVGSEIGTVVKQNVIAHLVTVEMEDGRELNVPVERLKFLENREKGE